MKTLILMIVSAFLCSFDLYAQPPPAIADEINSLWTQRKHDELEALLNAKLAQVPPDVVALYCARTFFLIVKPNKAKALESAQKLKQIADATQNPGFIEFAASRLAEMQAAPAAELPPPSAEALNMLHDKFSNKFPNIERGLKLKEYIIP